MTKKVLLTPARIRALTAVKRAGARGGYKGNGPMLTSCYGLKELGLVEGVPGTWSVFTITPEGEAALEGLGLL
jgi:hypothetical protein